MEFVTVSVTTFPSMSTSSTGLSSPWWVIRRCTRSSLGQIRLVKVLVVCKLQGIAVAPDPDLTLGGVVSGGGGTGPSKRLCTSTSSSAAAWSPTRSCTGSSVRRGV